MQAYRILELQASLTNIDNTNLNNNFLIRTLIVKPLITIPLSQQNFIKQSLNPAFTDAENNKAHNNSDSKVKIASISYKQLMKI